MKSFYWYISSRISKGDGLKRGFSRPIVVIATAAVAVGIAVMIIAMSIVKGFQKEVREKVIGFGSHVQVTQNSSEQSKESLRMPTNDSLVQVIYDIPSVRHVQKFAIKPAILETKKDVEGIIVKGVGSDFDWSFFNDKLVSGTILEKDSAGFKNHILVSEIVAARLTLSVGDKLTVYFVQNQEDVKPRTFRVKGIYNSGFVEFDEQFAFIPLPILAKVSQWGLEAQLRVNEEEDCYTVEGLGFGGEGMLSFQWNNGWRGSGPHILSKFSTEPIQLIVRDKFSTIPDTAWLDFTENDSSITYETRTSGSTHSEYCGGYEVLLKDYDSVINADDALTFSLPYYYRSETILQRFPEIFSWLGTLDINVVIIVFLMIFVAIINMASAILIIIIEKTNLIGMFKAFGSSTKKLSLIFLTVAARILVIGLIIGNAVGLSFCYLQSKFGFLKLNASNYYLDQVPVDMDWMRIFSIKSIIISLGQFFSELFTSTTSTEFFGHLSGFLSILNWNIYGLNFFVIMSCVLCMLIPVLYVSKIDPVKAIKFD